MLFMLIALWLSMASVADWDIHAQQAYEAGNYVESIQHYQIAIDGGFQSAELYFNLGNSYFELGEIGNAMLYYLRARELSPRDEMIQAQIERLRAIRQDYQQDAHQWADYLDDVLGSFLRLDEMLWVGVFAWGYGCLLVSYLVIRRQIRQRPIFLIVNLIIIGFIISATAFRWHSAIYRPKAVIIAPITAVMSGASQDYLTLYHLHAGAEIRIIERQGGWARLTLPDGGSGWINRFDFDYVSEQ